MQYQHVLVPIDLTKPDQHSLDIAIHFARADQAQVTLLHVIESIDETAETDEETSSFYADLEAGIRRNLNALSRLPEELLDQVRSEIIIGHRARDIVRYSTLNSVDLIVMRSDRVQPDQPTVAMRKISHHVSMFSQCPVLLVK